MPISRQILNQAYQTQDHSGQIQLLYEQLSTKKIWEFGQNLSYKLDDGRFGQLQVWKIFELLGEVECEALIIKYLNKKQIQCRYERIFSSINVLKFTFLQVLKFEDCSIRNIEALSFLQAPKLQKIYLNWNQITCITSLSKTNWSQLKVIFFGANYIQNVQNPNRIRMKKYRTFTKAIYHDWGFYAKQEDHVGREQDQIANIIRNNFQIKLSRGRWQRNVLKALKRGQRCF